MNGEDLRQYVQMIQSRTERHEELIQALSEKSEDRVNALAEKHEARMNAIDEKHERKNTALSQELTELKIDLVKLMVRYSFLGSISGTVVVAIPACIYWFVTK